MVMMECSKTSKRDAQRQQKVRERRRPWIEDEEEEQQQQDQLQQHRQHHIQQEYHAATASCFSSRPLSQLQKCLFVVIILSSHFCSAAALQLQPIVSLSSSSSCFNYHSCCRHWSDPGLDDDIIRIGLRKRQRRTNLSLSESLQQHQQQQQDTNNNNNNNMPMTIPIFDGPFHPSLLRTIWGKRPLLIRQAFPDYRQLQGQQIWPSWDDILELACDDGSTDSDEDEDENTADDEEYDDDDDTPTPAGESARLITNRGKDRLDSYALEAFGPLDPDFEQQLLVLDDDNDDDDDDDDDDNLGQATSTTKSSKNNNKKFWTILVNDVDRYVPALADWMDETFGGSRAATADDDDDDDDDRSTKSFLPRWRRDDAQVSIARGAGGGIGPHVDNYDVFLIQAQGRRLWKVGREPLESVQQEYNDLIPDLSVRILNVDQQQQQQKNNNDNDDDDEDKQQNDKNYPLTPSPPTPPLYYTFQDLELDPGDVLYIPPRFVHWGTALSSDANKNDDENDLCMTISVGCRAPSAAELTARVAEAMAETVAGMRRYRDDVTMLFQDYSSHDDDPGHPKQSTAATTETATSKREQQQAKDAVVVASSSSFSSSSPSSSFLPSISDRVKDDFKQLVRDAVEEILDNDLLWDELVGRLVTEPNRFNDRDVLQPHAESDPDYLQKWGEAPRDVIQTIIFLTTTAQQQQQQQQQNHGIAPAALYRTEGVSLATSRVKLNHDDKDSEEPAASTTTSVRDEKIIYRLFCHGQYWEFVSSGNNEGKENEDESDSDVVTMSILSSIERGMPVTGDLLRRASSKLIEFVETLVADGVLYASEVEGSDDEDEDNDDYGLIE